MNATAPMPATPERSCGFPVAERSCPVLRNEWVNGRYKHLQLEADAPLTRARPGEFFHLFCPQHGEAQRFLRRPMAD